VDTIDRIEMSVTVCMEQGLSFLALQIEIDEHHFVNAIVVPNIMRRELVVPSQPACIGLECYHAIGVEVVALTRITIVIRVWIADPPIDNIQLGIVGAIHPGTSPTALVRVSTPGFHILLVLPRNRIKAPESSAVLGIVSIYETSAGI